MNSRIVAILSILSGVLFFTPSFVFAENGLQILTGWQLLIKEIGQIIGDLIPILVALAVVVFFWGLIQYILSNGEAKKKEGRSIMFGGIFAIFIMVSLWGIITLMQDVFTIDRTATQSAPTLSTFGNNK